MPHYDWVIDTHPMAEEVSSVSKHVSGVNAAVVVMQTEVIRAENEAADQVCQNINTGFYTLIRSQISQKIAKLKSEADSQLMELSMQQKALLALKSRMERDYNMIKRRYKALFGNLNDNLHNRIFELDKPVMNFVLSEIASGVRRINREIAAVPVNQKESLALEQTIVAGRTRYNGTKTMESIKSFVGQILEQRKMTGSIVLNEKVEENRRWSFPVLVVESKGKNETEELTTLYTPQFSDEVLNSRFNATAKNTVYSQVAQFEWEEISREEQDRITGEFNAALAASSASERVKDMMQRMFRSASWQTLKD